ncbi:unnamed protein product [Brachionus calyciflorus]|uniref:Uncharacterized protein n=1 Tax=Brachionus calyciflorus TaxID=104777 RepID=A0A814KBD3_9BILA|nr:unnamed protein product [Brachionus calyciflorus]
MKLDHLTSIFSYIDLIDSCESIFEIIQCFLNAAAWALNGLFAFKHDHLKSYSFSRMVFHLIKESSSIAHYYLNFSNKAYYFRFAFAITYYTNVFGLDEDNKMVRNNSKFYLLYNSLIPFVNISFITTSESTLVQIQMIRFCEKYMHKLELTKLKQKPIKDHLIKYVIYENIKNGITEDLDEKEHDIKTKIAFLDTMYGKCRKLFVL